MLINSQGQPVDPFAPIGACSQCGAAAWTATNTDGLLCPDHAGVWEEMQKTQSQPTYTKTITPAFEIKKNGKKGKLTGYIGELHDGDTLLHSMDYSTNSQAEQALDALAFELLTDLAEQGALDELPTFDPTTCVYCHKPHHPADCPEMRAMLFTPASLIYPPLDVDFAPAAWEV